MILRADETTHAHSGHQRRDDDVLIDLTDASRDLPLASPPPTSRSRRRQVPIPLEVRAAQQWSAQWLVPLAAAEQLLAPSGLRPAQALPGRGLLTISFSRILDGGLGRYHELRVALQVARHDGLSNSRPGRILESLGDSHGELVLDQPISERSVGEAGQLVWGLPTRAAELEIVPQGNRTACTLAGEDGHELTLTVLDGGPLSVPLNAPATYTWHEGVLRMTTWRVQEGRGGRRPGGAALVLSRHGALPTLLRSLGLPKRALLATTFSHLRASYDASCVVAPDS